ncbi:NAD-dependent deacylase [Desulfococcaceae bacterium OttesenSCG-928-F15]|nr:NAD-dependent deacylase [Desulfococcaceae bacterium OttesenSCG-928-F15]
MEKKIAEAAARLKKCRHVVALTGAGISVESGIPDFRSAGGLWEKYDPSEYAHIDAFYRKPNQVWQMLSDMYELLHPAKPNPAHLALADMERDGVLKEIITQNIDSLHQKAGNTRVIEFHGHFRTLKCESCGARKKTEEISVEELPPLCAKCGRAMRPEIVFFGEGIPPKAYEDAMQAVSLCDGLIIIGTSAVVAPASYLPGIARDRGAFILEVNLETTPLSRKIVDLHIGGSAGSILPLLVEAIRG